MRRGGHALPHAGACGGAGVFSLAWRGEEPGPLPWQERGLRAALADASPEVRSHAVLHIISEGWARTFLTEKDLEPLLLCAEWKAG